MSKTKKIILAITVASSVGIAYVINSFKNFPDIFDLSDEEDEDEEQEDEQEDEYIEND